MRETADTFLRRLRHARSRAATATSDFDLNTGIDLPPGRKLRPASVLISFQEIDGVWRLWLTRRSPKLKNHPGQIAFPGGKQDPGDVNAIDTALREAEEELGLPPSAVEILGALPAHETVTGFRVTPVLARVREAFTPRPHDGEVAEAFHVPASHVLDPAQFRVEGRVWNGMTRHYYTVPFGPYYIWGATARILRGLADAAHDAP